MEEPRDEEIARRVQRGESSLFGELVTRYEERLLRYAKKFLLDAEDAKDLLQDVFMKAYVNIQSFDIARKFSSWIYRIAHNEFVNAIKKRSGREIFSLFDFDTILPHPVAKETADEGAHRKEMRAMLDRGLAVLNPKYREPLVLYYFEEMSYREIAEILEIPTSTVGVRLERGKKKLKEALHHD